MTDEVLILNSASASVSNLSAGYASYNLTSPLRFGDSNVKVALNTFHFTNYFFNITAALGNNKIYYSDDALDETKYTITIPDGSYSVESLNTTINNELIEQGFAPALAELLGDESQNKAYFLFGALVGWYFHLGADGPNTILGTVAGDELPASKANTAGEAVYATNTAAFNNIEVINISTNICSNFIYGVNRSSILYSCLPTVPIGSTQNEAPRNLLWADAPSLKQGLTNIVIQLHDQDGNSISMKENWTVILQMRVSSPADDVRA